MLFVDCVESSGIRLEDRQQFVDITRRSQWETPLKSPAYPSPDQLPIHDVYLFFISFSGDLWRKPKKNNIATWGVNCCCHHYYCLEITKKNNIISDPLKWSSNRFETVAARFSFVMLGLAGACNVMDYRIASRYDAVGRFVSEKCKSLVRSFCCAIYCCEREREREIDVFGKPHAR